MKNQILFSAMVVLIATLGIAAPANAQTITGEIKRGRLLKRAKKGEPDNYPFAVYSFKCGGNGPEVQQTCRNNWDIIFGNGIISDALDVTMVTDDRSRIKDLGSHTWADKIRIPSLAAYEEPEREPSIAAIEGHLYLVHTRNTRYNYYALFRVDKLVSGESIDISWKLIPPPNSQPVIATPGSVTDVKRGGLQARSRKAGVDNYEFATYSFTFGGNGPEIKQSCRNKWDILFGNGVMPDMVDVSMVSGDRSRIKDLGRHTWDEKFVVPSLSAYEEPERDPRAQAIEGHMYLVHTRDRDTDSYALFRVETLVPEQSIEITWKLISRP